MFCPVCQAEYHEGFKTCVACRVDLVPQLPMAACAIPFTPEETAAAAELPANWDSATASIAVWKGRDQAHLQFIEASLQGVGVPTRRMPEDDGVVRLLIRHEDEERGREVVRQILQRDIPQKPLPAPQEFMWVDEPPKSYSLIWATSGAYLLLCFLALSFPGLSPGAATLMTGLLRLATVVANIGALWMLYQSVRYEIRPLRYCLLAIVPFSFVWYYYERFSKRQGVRRLPVAIRTRLSPPPSP
jgi:hypothetical protein